MKTDDQLTERAKEAFDRSVDALDAATLSRLNRSRQAALDQRLQSRRQWQRWVPATGVAVAVLMVVLTQQDGGDAGPMGAPLPDLDILMGEESIEMFEDLEFYSWLDSQELEGDGDLG